MYDSKEQSSFLKRSHHLDDIHFLSQLNKKEQNSIFVQSLFLLSNEKRANERDRVRKHGDQKRKRERKGQLVSSSCESYLTHSLSFYSHLNVRSS